MLQHVDKQIRQRLIISLVKGEVPTMPEAASANQDWHIAVVVVRGVSKIACQQNASVVEYVSTLLLCSGQISQKLSPRANDCGFDNRKLFELIAVTTVVAECVIALVNAFQRHDAATTAKNSTPGQYA